MLMEYSRDLTKEEFAKIIHTDINSEFFKRLGDDPIIMRMPRSDENTPIWYHVDAGGDFYGNFEVKEYLREVWVDSKTIAKEFDLKPRKYGFWFLWTKF